MKEPKPCKNPAYPPDKMASPHRDDISDAVGLQSQSLCCAVHYVRHLRYKFDLDKHHD